MLMSILRIDFIRAVMLNPLYHNRGQLSAPIRARL